MRNAGLEETQAGIKIAGRNINNLRRADDTTLMTESEEELKNLLTRDWSCTDHVALMHCSRGWSCNDHAATMYWITGIYLGVFHLWLFYLFITIFKKPMVSLEICLKTLNFVFNS